MIKGYFLLLILFISFSSIAQIRKNAFLLGAEISYYNNKDQSGNLSQKYETGNFGISLGKAFKENSVTGLHISYSPMRQTNIVNATDTFDLSFNTYNIGVFFRKYKMLVKDFYLFAQADAAFIIGNQKAIYKSAINNATANQTGGSLSLAPGISYRLFKKLQVELMIPNLVGAQYMLTKIEYKNPQIKNIKNEQIGFYSNLSYSSLSWLGIGFRFVF